MYSSLGLKRFLDLNVWWLLIFLVGMNFIFCSFVKLNKKKCSKLALFSIQVTKWECGGRCSETPPLELPGPRNLCAKREKIPQSLSSQLTRDQSFYSYIFLNTYCVTLYFSTHLVLVQRGNSELIWWQASVAVQCQPDPLFPAHLPVTTKFVVPLAVPNWFVATQV